MTRYDRSLELFEQARRLIPGGSQTTSKRPQMFAYGAYPIYAARASGARIEDVDGNIYIDLVNALGPIILGYNDPDVRAAILAQLDKGILSGLLYPAEVEAARLITELVPGMQMARFFKGGGEATAAAARLVRAHTGRELILNCGYRGWPDVWTAAQNDGGVPRALAEAIISFPFNDLAALEGLLAAHRGQVAGVFLDILRDAPEPGYLQGVRELARQHGALFVIDEVVTGFRLAPGGAGEYYDARPDLACFAKAMANGMPLSAVAGRAEVMQTMERLRISVTYGGEALSLAAAVACMTKVRDADVPGYLWRLGAVLMAGLDAAAEQHAIPFRCTGLEPMSMMTFDGLDPEGETLVWSYFLQEMASRGVLMRRGGVNFLTLSHTDDDVRQVVAAAEDVFAQLRPLWGRPELARQVRVRDVQTGHRSFVGPSAESRR